MRLYGSLLVALPLASLAAAAPLTLVVSPQGNDQWSGRLDAPNDAGTDGPLATLERARDVARQARKDGGSAAGVLIELRAGRYDLTQPLALTAEDSGTAEAPLVIRARAKEQVTLSGGRAVTGWQPVTDPAVLARLDPSARGHVFWCDLKAQGITEYGDLGLDAEAPLQTRLARSEGQGEYIMGSAMASGGKTVRPRLELFFHDAPMTLCRWPNEGSIKIEEVLGKTEVNVRGTISCVEGEFVYEGDRPRRWVGEPDGWVGGSWCRDWAEQVHPIASIDPERRVIAVQRPYHYYGYRKGQWFYGLNLLCELDQPGEWYLDRTSGLLYFWPPSDLAAGRAEVSVCPGLLTLTDTAHVQVRGLRFETARGTGLTIRNGVACQVVGCTFRNLANHGVVVDGGRADRVAGCDFEGLGGGGIYLVGGDRATLTPGEHVAENNHIHHYARWDRMYRPGVMVMGVGQRVSHNLIHDAPHSAIIFSGQEHVFALNEIHSVCYDSNDCGAIYSGRNWALRGHQIRNNYLHHLYGRLGAACRGIYLDDGFSSAKVTGNLFWQVTYAVFLGGGRDNLVEHNVFIDCPGAMHVDARGLGWQTPHAEGRIKEAREKGTIGGVRFGEPPFSTRWPELLRLLDDEPKAPKGNVVRRNIFWAGTGEDLRRFARGADPGEGWWNHLDALSKTYVKVEHNLVNVDPRFVDEAAGRFQLRPDSPAWALGFQRLPVEQIGLYASPERASWPVTHAARPMPGP